VGLSQQIGASSLSKPGVCTSSTRPATPYEGQMIYETDTDKVLVWNGTAWVIPNSPAQNPTALELITTTTWTAATSVNIDSVFTSNYNNYLVLCQLVSNANNQEVYLRMRVGGVTDSGASDYAQVVDQRYAATAALSGSNATDALTLGGVSTTSYTTYEINIFQPFDATVSTQTYAQGMNIQASYTADFRTTRGFRRTAKSHDGFTVATLSATTIAGTIRVYGYRNS
jgi:hypothetical protein